MTSTHPSALAPDTRERLLNLINLAYDCDDQSTEFNERMALAGDLYAIKHRAGQQLLDRILTSLYEDMPEYEMRMDGVGTFTKTRGTKRKNWDHARAAAVVAARAADGVMEQVPPAVLADLVMRELLACAGVSYWRKGEMKRRHIDADKFCEPEEGTPSVVFKPVVS